jgi:hypothetical protein
MDKNELAKQIYETEKAIEASRNRRNTITIAIFALVFFLIFYLDEKPTGVYEILGTAAVSFVASAFHFLINAAVFGALHEKNETERKTINRIKEQLDNTKL